MLGESAYQLAQLSDIKNITAASSSILRIFLDSAYEPICAAAHIGSVTAGTPWRAPKAGRPASWPAGSSIGSVRAARSWSGRC